MTIYQPTPQGGFAPVGQWVREQGKAPRFSLSKHPHVMRVISWTETGPLRVLMGCPKCSKTDVIEPSRLKRSIPDGFTAASWAELNDKADARAVAAGHKDHRTFVREYRKGLH